MKPLWGKLCNVWQHSQTGDTPLWERRSKSWEEMRLPKELWERTVGCSQKYLPGKAGGIETTLSRFCLCIANSNIAECCVVISHPEIPTERTNLQSPGCCFAAMQIYGLFFLLSHCHTCSTSSAVLHGTVTEGRVADWIWKLVPPDTCHLELKSW